jgi:hypothetical protein
MKLRWMLAVIALAFVLIAANHYRHQTVPAPVTRPAVTATTTTPVSAVGSAGCETDWVCGTCPNGDTWAYLNDGSPEATWVRQNNVIFDTHRPCQ